MQYFRKLPHIYYVVLNLGHNIVTVQFPSPQEKQSKQLP